MQQAGGCTYDVSPTTISVASLGGFASLALVASHVACPWTASSPVTWAAITSAPSGTGSTTVNVGVEPNTGVARSTTLTVGGHSIPVTQVAWGCTFGITPLAITAPAAGATGTVLVSAAHAGCAWTAAGSPSWITFPGGASGSGSATLAYAIAPNYAPAERQGGFTVGGYAVAVTQAASACTFALDRTSLAFGTNGGAETLGITTSDASCAWTASTASGWLTVHPTSGSGTATITVTATGNYSTTRTASLGVAGITVAVSQDGSVTPSGPMTCYLAEGATSAFLDTRLALLNPGSIGTSATLTFSRVGNSPVTHVVSVPAYTRVTVNPKLIAGMAVAEFSTKVESDQPLVVDRTLSWDAAGYGAHAETAVAAPSPIWYLAEGATHSGLDLFYLLQNPSATATTVRVRYLRPSGAPIEKDYVLAPASRTNIWVDVEDFPGPGPRPRQHRRQCRDRIARRDADHRRARGVLSNQGRLFNAGHESVGVTAPALQWFLAEGSTGAYFDLFVLIANPNDQAADVRVTYLLTNGQTYTRTLTAPPNSRSNIWVDVEQFPGISGYPLADVAVSTTVVSENAVPIIVERALWWPGDFTTWHEAHNSAGATETGTVWALAEGEAAAGSPRGDETYILIANTSAFPGQARVTLYFEDGTSAQATYALPANSRSNVAVGPDFGVVVLGKRFGAVIESLGTTPAQIVVERAMYWNAVGQRWAAGTNALAMKLR